MLYSRIYFRNRAKPHSILILLAIFSMIIFFGFLILSNFTLKSKASKINIIRSHEVNLSPTQAGIFWQTEKNETGWIIFGTDKNKLEKIAYDSRDSSSQQHSYIYHYSKLGSMENYSKKKEYDEPLTENTVYYYRIILNKESVYPAPDSLPLSFKTPKKTVIRSNLIPAYGIVIQANGRPAENAVIIFNIENRFPILTFTKAKGEFMLPLSFLIDKNTNSMIAPGEKESVEIEILTDTGKSIIKSLLNQTNPFVKTLVIGQDYNLFEKNNVLGSTSDAIDGINNVGVNNDISIIFPKENSIVASQRPLFKGRAFPNKEIILSIDSNPEYIFRTEVTKEGEWKIIPQNPILPGNYSLLLTTYDNNEKKIIIKRNFTIAKSGEQVLGEATAEPTLELTNTPIPTYFSDISEAPYNLSPTPPRTGTDQNSLLLLGCSLIIVGIGVMLVF